MIVVKVKVEEMANLDSNLLEIEGKVESSIPTPPHSYIKNSISSQKEHN